MTTLLPPPRRTERSARPGAQVRDSPETRRPLVAVATAGGAAAALLTLMVCLGVALVGWFLTDGGGHGTPRDGLRVGALAWLTGHGSGVRVEGVEVTAMPLGLTLLCAWAAWRAGQRVGVAVSAHGPDAAGLADGQRDLVVPWAGLLFTTGYAVVAVAVATLAATPATDPSAPHVVLWALLLGLGVGTPAIAVGSGRAAVWTAAVPATVRASLATARRVLLVWCSVALVAFLVSLAVDFSTAANVMSQVGGGGGAVAVMVVFSLVVLPNAVLFSSSYLLGPGFTVGSGTLVTPTAAVLGPLPAFPLLAALPDNGPGPSWSGWLLVLPPLVAALGAVWSQWRWPTAYYAEGAIRGATGGVVAGLALGLVTSLAGGAVGPGRMRDVAPYAFDVLLHSVTAFGLGGLIGGLAITWWQRRTMPIEIELEA